MPGRLETILRTIDKRHETSASENLGAFAVFSRHMWHQISRAGTSRLLGSLNHRPTPPPPPPKKAPTSRWEP